MTIISIVPISLGVTDIRKDMVIYTIGKGLPVPFYMKDINDNGNFQGSSWSYVWLLIDLIVWYFISSLVIHLFRKLRK